jgi:SNF2 family DNA or RNA helicase
MCRQVIDPGGLLRVEPPQQEEEENREEDTSQPMDVEEEPRAPESTKIRTVVRDVRDFLESSNNKILVFFTGSAMMHAYSEAFEAAGISHEAVDGRTSIPRRSRLFQSFQEEQGDDACRVLLLTTRVAAAGITLTAANIVLCVSPSIPRGLEDQMVGRANRIGQTQAVLFRRYVAGRTIEAAVAQRDEMSYALLGDMLTTQRLESRR